MKEEMTTKNIHLLLIIEIDRVVEEVIVVAALKNEVVIDLISNLHLTKHQDIHKIPRKEIQELNISLQDIRTTLVVTLNTILNQRDLAKKEAMLMLNKLLKQLLALNRGEIKNKVILM